LEELESIPHKNVSVTLKFRLTPLFKEDRIYADDKKTYIYDYGEGCWKNSTLGIAEDSFIPYVFNYRLDDKLKLMDKVLIPNSKNENISAVIHRPEKQTEKLAILCPGYLDSKDYDHLVRLAEALAERGYTVVRFDPTGTWESEGSISEYLTSQYLKDIKSVLEYMLARGNYSHVLLGGHSRGGRVSILYAARDPRISTVLGIMPSSGPIGGQRYKQWERRGFRISKRDVPGKTGKREFQVPYSHVIDTDQFDVLEDVKKIRVPIIFIAGASDIVVLPEDVRQIFDRANEPKKFILIQGIGHDYRFNPSEIKTVNDQILKAL
jgi:putative redox protein